MSIPGPISPPDRLLMGPGPINADPRVLQAMAAPLVGQFDPFMTQTMAETSELYRTVFQTQNEATLLIDGTARAGVEAALVSILAPGDRVVVPSFGRFGHLLVEIAERCGAVVTTVDAPWGEVVPLDEIAAVVAATEPKLVAIVQGDTSTTMCQPLDGLGPICHDHGALLYADVTASLAGNRFPMDAWELDAASAGLQKCLGGPSGSAPLSLSPAAVEAIRSRSSVEAGLVDGDEQRPTDERIRSNYFDLGMILDYWGPRRLNHHTEATSMLYAARECARLLALEGMDAAVERHRVNGAALAAGLQALDLRPYGDQGHRMHNVVAVHIPDGLDGDAVRGDLLARHGIEIGTSFGPLHGKVWRVGTMGVNARPEAVLRTLAALEQVLRAHGVVVPEHGGVDAATDQYAREEQP